jgi:hypothetical protein
MSEKCPLRGNTVHLSPIVGSRMRTLTVFGMMTSILGAALLSTAAKSDANELNSQTDQEFAVYLVAENGLDDAIIEAARKTEGPIVRLNDEQVARWVPVTKHAKDTIREMEGVVTRPKLQEDSQMQLLVLIPDAPITEGHLNSCRPTRDATNHPAVAFRLTKEGGKRMVNLTGPNVGRILAVVVDGEIHMAATLHSRIRRRGQISGYENDVQRDQAISVIQAHATGSPSFDKQDIVRLVVIGLLLLSVMGLLVLGLMPTRGYRPPRVPRFWTILGGILGALVGAYNLGFSITAASGVGASNGIVVEKTYTISLLWLGIGAVVGGLLGIFALRGTRWGLLRAWHNAKRLIGR